MKKTILAIAANTAIFAFLAILTISAVSCKQAAEDSPKVMARFVPERYDDFIFENNLICGRIYGQSLEHDGDNLVSPGIDIWVKLPGPLVADMRYKDELENGRTYHKDWGNGKDCYKVSRSLGAGASAVVIGGRILYPATNYHEWECTQDKDTVVFTLTYPQWESDGESIALRKTFTVIPDTYFVKVEDVYTFSGAFGDSLEVAAGVFRHPDQNTIVEEYPGLSSGCPSENEVTDRYAIWERASDQSVEPEDGMLGVAIYVPGATSCHLSDGGEHGLVGKVVKSGEPFVYYFGNCWSKGDVKTASEWFDIVASR